MPKRPLPATTDEETYARLSAQFRSTFKDQRGGQSFDYITGGQCVQRLNDVLGIGGWDFQILGDGFIKDGSRGEGVATEVWVRGRLTITLPSGKVVCRDQYGSQKIKYLKVPQGVTTAPGMLDVGFELKGAATDSLKKCASLFGVGLYLGMKQGASGDEMDSVEVAEPIRPAARPAPQPTRPAPTPTDPTPIRPPPTQATPPGPNPTAASKTAVRAAQSQNGAAQGFPAIPEQVRGCLNLTREFKPPTTDEKKSFYIDVSKRFGVSRQAVFEILGLDPKTQHIDEYLRAGATTLTGIRGLCAIRALNDGDDIHIPSYAELMARRQAKAAQAKEG